MERSQPPALAVMDGFTLNPGDLTWEPLQALAKCEIYERTGPEEVVVRAVAADLVLTNKVVLGREHLARLPRLRYIGVLATGTNIVDLEAARERGIPVTNVPAYSTRSVAQATFALLLELTNRAGDYSRGVREGRWSRSPDFAYWDAPLIELAGLTLGIIGLGRNGRAVAELGAAFGMQMLAYSPRPKEAPAFVRWAELKSVFAQSDVLSLHCPLTPETRHLINAERLGWMKPSAFLINTGRGPLVDEEALADALNSGKLAGAGLDVLSKEPPPADNPLLRAANCVITPHQAWATRAARQRLLAIAAENVRAFLAGQPQNVVNG